MEICILTPGLGEADRYDQLWRRGFERLRAMLDRRGHTVVSAPWTDAPISCDFVLPLLAWGYHLDLPLWLQAVTALEAASMPVLNSPSVLRWNADKIYLQRLAEAGAATVPTLHAATMNAAALAEAAARFGTASLVVKPRVSGGAHGTVRAFAGRPLPEGAPDGPVMIQPFLPAVGGEGELSMLYFGGRFSHALTKTALPGEFRVQPQYGGVVRAAEPDAAAFATAEVVLAAVAEALLYARVDLIRDEAGDWRLMELELIEPYLFLDEAPDRGAAFVDALEFAASHG